MSGRQDHSATTAASSVGPTSSDFVLDLLAEHRLGPGLSLAGVAVTNSVTLASAISLWQTFAP